jgi:phenylacetate-CoA ligase
MAEIVANASECVKGRLHLWPEIGHVEVVKGAASDGEKTPGELICTGLLNDDMPLIRYRVGDRGSLASPGDSCECGRGLPILLSVEGRMDDVLYTSDGRAIGRLDPIFKSRTPLSEAQIIQDRLDLIRIRFVPDAQFSSSDAQSLIERVRERMGPVEVVLEAVDSIPRGSNGKFRSVICNLSDDERKNIARL